MTWKQMKRTWRRAEKNRMMTFRQLAGLAGALVCTMLIYLWVADERQMDHFGLNDARLVQVLENNPAANTLRTSEQTPGPLAAALPSEMVEVEKSVAVVPAAGLDKQAIISLGDTEYYADAQFAGRDYFHLFSYPLLEGDADQVLKERNQIVVSKTFAEKLFHQSRGIQGRVIACNQQDTTAFFTISGVFDNTAEVASITFDVLLPYELYLAKNSKLSDWRNTGPQTFALLKKGTSIDRFSRKLASFPQTKNPASRSSLFAQRYADKYLHNHYEDGKPSGGKIEYVILFSLVAFVILFIACASFMNLATAFANEKMQQANIKNVPGSSRKMIAWQFFCESMIMCTGILLLALLFVYLSLPAFNIMTGKQLSLHPDGGLLLIIAAITAVTSLAAGAYPALYLSGARPLTAIRGRLKGSGKQQFLRKVLVILQFFFSAL